MKNSEKIVGEIYETKNYEKFKSVERNRGQKRNKSKYQSLKESLLRYGMLVPIICTFRNGSFEVGDGEGRLMAAKELDIPVKYIFHLEDSNVRKRKLITDINNTQDKWNLQNYLDWNIEKPHYAYVSKIQKTFPSVSISDIVYVFGEENNTTLFRNGIFKAKNRAKNKKIIRCLSHISQYRLSKYRRTKNAVVQLCREDYPVPFIVEAVKVIDEGDIFIPDSYGEIKDLIEKHTIDVMKKDKLRVKKLDLCVNGS